MLTTYRRHKRECKHRKEGRKYRRCRCPIWVDGFLGGREVRKSLDTADWQKAQDKVREWESRESEPTPAPEPISIQVAGERFLVDATSQKLTESTIGKYRLLFKQIRNFSQNRGLRYLKELDLVTLDEFRAGWKDGARSSAKKLERLRRFFRFAQERDWVAKNPAAGIRAPKVTLCPTMPYTPAEMLRILAAIDKYRDAFPARGRENALRLRGLVLLLRYSGLRIGDAVSLTTDRVQGDRLFLYTHKTGVAVNTILPDFVLKTLEAIPKVTDRHFFWDGMGKLETIVGSWRRRLSKLFELAEVAKGHAHRFRDTFAVELLLSGVPIERVSVLLGHQSVRITEKHYSPWVRSRQEQLEADLRRSWEQDPVSLMETKGTSEVHEKNERIN
jgi:integrase/recombinase XerD